MRLLETCPTQGSFLPPFSCVDATKNHKLNLHMIYAKGVAMDYQLLELDDEETVWIYQIINDTPYGRTCAFLTYLSMANTNCQ